LSPVYSFFFLRVLQSLVLRRRSRLSSGFLDWLFLFQHGDPVSGDGYQICLSRLDQSTLPQVVQTTLIIPCCCPVCVRPCCPWECGLNRFFPWGVSTLGARKDLRCLTRFGPRRITRLRPGVCPCVSFGLFNLCTLTFLKNTIGCQRADTVIFFVLGFIFPSMWSCLSLVSMRSLTPTGRSDHKSKSQCLLCNVLPFAHLVGFSLPPFVYTSSPSCLVV